MRDVESALLETEQFTQSHTLGQFVIEYDPQDPDSHIICSGHPRWRSRIAVGALAHRRVSGVAGRIRRRRQSDRNGSLER